ncbi:MAG: hypothetical protein JJE52_04785 [Acidimicrobiia bacterium]|nr:hypothetical protein [Acidimicrobiia bacterium]
MADEMDLLRDFRHDLVEPDTASMGRLVASIQAQTAVVTAPPPGEAGERPDGEVVLALTDSPRRPRHGAVALAAVVVLVVGIVAWGLSVRDDGVATDTGAPLAPLVADPAPEGFTLVSGRPVDREGGGRRTVYVPAGSAGPYDGPMITVIATPWPESAAAASVEPVETYVVEDGDFMVLVGGTASHSHHLMARGLSLDAARVAHAGVVVGEDGSPHVDPDALPPGWRAVEVDDPWLDGDPASAGSLLYRGPTDAAQHVNVMSVGWARGNEDDLGHLRLFNARVETCTDVDDGGCARVGGNPTVLAMTSTPDGVSNSLSWVDGDRVVNISGSGPSVEDLYALATSLRPSTWDEIEGLARQP